MLPPGFMLLEEADFTILYDIKYSTSDNFIGRPLAGYVTSRCVVTASMGQALKRAQANARAQGYLLKIFDAYRPLRAVEDICFWAQDPFDQKEKEKYFPNVEKNLLFQEGYITLRSSHTRGAAVDLTLVKLNSASKNFELKEIEMGTRFDFLDELSHTKNTHISQEAQENRAFLCTLMEANGFQNYTKEWWHFTLREEPFPNSYFDFII